MEKDLDCINEQLFYDLLEQLLTIPGASGNEEKIRVRSEMGTAGIVKKFFELIFKTTAATVIYILYIIKGQELKGRYVFFSQWFTLKGFLQKSVFVR